MRWAAWLLLTILAGWLTFVALRAQSADMDYRISTEGRMARLEARLDSIDAILKGVLIAVAGQLLISGVGRLRR